MEFITTLLPVLLVLQVLNIAQQRARVQRLAQLLRRHPIEPLIQRLMQGIMAGLDQPTASARADAWRALQATEADLELHLHRLALDLAQAPEAPWRLSRLPIALPWATRWRAQTLDFRKLVALHANAFSRAIVHGVRSPAQRAHTVLAELMLLQHSCHWYCRSWGVASARLVARHHTSHAQVLEAVDAQTRRDYQALTRMTLRSG